jgi:hypothetical protein
MSVTLIFKDGLARIFHDATEARLLGGAVIVRRPDGSVAGGPFNPEQIEQVNGRPLHTLYPRRTRNAS